LFIRRPRWEFASNFDSACFFSLNTCWLVWSIHFHFYPLSVIITQMGILSSRCRWGCFARWQKRWKWCWWCSNCFERS
jgi:hypothetical protein